VEPKWLERPVNLPTTGNPNFLSREKAEEAENVGIGVGSALVAPSKGVPGIGIKN